MTTILGPKGLPFVEANAELSWDDLSRARAGAKHLPGQHDQQSHAGDLSGGGVLPVSKPVPPTKRLPARDLPAFGLTPEAQQALYTDLEENYGVTHEALVSEIKDRIGDDPEFVAEAAKWYPEAKATAQELANGSDGKITLEQAQAVIAVISPRTTWPGNVKSARTIVQNYLDGKSADLSPEEAVSRLKDERKSLGQPMPIGFDDNLAKAFAILNGADIDSTLTGLKVRSFFNNIDNPGETRDVTVDGHMAKMLGALGVEKKRAESLLTKEKKDPPFAGEGYIAISDAVRAVADEMGVAPDTIQAAYWLKVQKTKWSALR